MAHLGQISRPKDIVGRRPGPVVRQHGAGNVLFEKNRIPEIASRRCYDPGREMIGKILEAIAEPQRGDLPPVWIEEIVGIKVDELTDQPAKGGFGEGVDLLDEPTSDRLV